ncbi:hypothetical protein R2R35_07605 [Anaerocolumna sp. AGMB13020]|uniref:hypothetical protein n=1 Tax=Anaerocolumna sp. AGMB13020 TaxID=3081750 RepID=UPI002953F27D|nr:hypothetical protein [Anaerocolumna sp. AGMB13020]WOO38359.1 hypothetical protein R2R35_07605 [Anaerocolumna sp. AGMB13020]
MACGGFNSNQSLVAHLCQYIGETVTIFTKSGGVSGCGFTGVLFAVNCEFVQIVTDFGSAPTNPIGGPNSSCCNNLYPENKCSYEYQRTGSVCDIPVDKIAAFCHNAV